MDNKKKSNKKISRFRLTIQSIALLLQNTNFSGFFTGKISQSTTKSVCVPGLNCYSCPGAIGACPIGSLQNNLSSLRFKFPYYVLGLLIFFGTLLGRAICGFLCPLGLLQDLVYKIPFVKKLKTFKGDKLLRKLKYIILLVFVIILPICIKLTPTFCKYICPSGTISGILLSITNSDIANILGSHFIFKLVILIAIIILDVIIYRPFCKYICPLGAIYGPFNKISILQMQVDKSKCTNCGLCDKVCNMNVEPIKNINSVECIRCGKCVENCPSKAICYTTCFKKG